MTDKSNNNKTYKQKIGDAVVRVGGGLLCAVLAVVATIVVVICAFGEKASAKGKEWAQEAQAKSASKAAENFAQAGSDTKEAYNLYRQPAEEEVKTPEDKVEPVDEGYSSSNESVTA